MPRTQAAYIRVPMRVRATVQAAGLPFRDGLHAAAHAMLNVLPLFLPCEAVDVTTECDNPYRTTYRPERLLIYDWHPGGIGLAARVRAVSKGRCSCLPGHLACSVTLLAWSFACLVTLLAWSPCLVTLLALSACLPGHLLA